jgi:hypothetical protein
MNKGNTLRIGAVR